MKLKDRFKKALFAFFKEEILKNVGYNGQIHSTQIKHKRFKAIASSCASIVVYHYKRALTWIIAKTIIVLEMTSTIVYNGRVYEQ